MKRLYKIALLASDAYYWKFIELSFKGINADVSVMPPDAAEEDVLAAGASLLVVDIDRLAPLSSPLRRIKTIVIVDEKRNLPEQTSTSRKKMSFLKWPVTKEQLLRETASMLQISPRKKFRALVRISSPDAEAAVIGRSIDFSSTGMSFTAEKYYSIGHEVMVSLAIPGDGERLILSGRVVRQWTNETDGAGEYGVEFRSLDRVTAKALESFVLR